MRCQKQSPGAGNATTAPPPPPPHLLEQKAKLRVCPHFELFVRLLHGLPVTLLAPVVPVQTEKSHGPSVVQKEVSTRGLVGCSSGQRKLAFGAKVKELEELVALKPMGTGLVDQMRGHERNIRAGLQRHGDLLCYGTLTQVRSELGGGAEATPHQV